MAGNFIGSLFTDAADAQDATKRPQTSWDAPEQTFNVKAANWIGNTIKDVSNLGVAQSISGILSYIGEGQKKREGDIAKGIVGTLDQGRADLSDLGTITERMKSIGGQIERSSTLKNDPMLVVSQMGAEASAGGAVAMQKLLNIQLGSGFKVYMGGILGQVQSLAGLDRN
jgi:hypothetical protein